MLYTGNFESLGYVMLNYVKLDKVINERFFNTN